MPVVLNLEDDFAIHEEATKWEYEEQCGVPMYVIRDEDNNHVAEAPMQNVNQIQHLTEEEADEVMDMLF